MSEQKTSTIKSIDGVKPFDGRNGTIYYHKVTLDNGESGEVGKKKNNAFNIGDSFTYTSESSEYGLKFKEVFQGGGGFGGGQRGGGQQRGSSASFALSYAKDLAVANIAKSDKPIDMEALSAKVISAASKFQSWLKENE